MTAGTVGTSLSAVKQAQDALMAFVRSAPAGTRLPTERDLAKRFGVSRTTVRSAVDRLVLLGYLRVRHGSGTVTVRPGPDLIGAAFATAVADVAASASDIYAVRLMLEPVLAAQAARSSTPRQAGDLRDAAAGADAGFHLALARFTNNAIAAQLVGVLAGLGSDARSTPTEAPQPGTSSNSTRAGAAVRQHLAIVDAVADGDPDLARASMRLHLKWEARQRKVD